VSGNKWDKKFRFDISDKEMISRLINERDKNLYPNEADYVAQLFRLHSGDFLNPVVDVSPEQQKYYEDLISLCPRNLMTIVGNIPTCTHKLYSYGIQRMRYFVYEKPHPNAGSQMSYNDIKGICDKCTQGFTEDERIQELKKLYELKEITIYTCNNPNSDSIESTAFRTNKFVCPAQAGKHVKIDRTCIKKQCKYLVINVYPLPSMAEEDI